MTEHLQQSGHFPGWPIQRANTTYTPNQFFDVVVRNSSRGCVRIVGYMLRRALGWCDANGEPVEEQLRVTYNDLIERAGVSRGAIGPALQEALNNRYIIRVQEAHPNAAGNPSQSAVYELRWDEENDWTTDPAQFQGFYFREDGACRTSVPNVFFDYFLPKEPLSVIRVVSAVLRHSIGFGKGGERRKDVQLSVTDLERITGMSDRHVHKALVYAVEAGYVTRVDEGHADLVHGGKENRKATYALHWTSAYTYGADGWHHTQPLEDVADASNGSKRSTDVEPTVQEGQPVDGSKRSTASPGGRFKKVNRNGSKRDTATVQEGQPERFKKVNHIEIKPLRNNTPRNETPEKQQQQDADAPVAAAPGELIGMGLLIGEGFSREVARHLAQTYSLEVIQNQVAWFPLRTPTKNRLGMLRTAIEENWEQPAGPATTSNTAGATFAAHFYAGRAGNDDAPVAPPTDREIAAGDELAVRLRELHPSAGDEQFARWGRDFGQQVIEAERYQDRRTTGLLAALRAYGDEFYTRVKERRQRAAEEARYDAEAQHYEQHYPAYVQFVQETIETIQREQPERYTTWLAEYEIKCKRLGVRGSDEDLFWAFARALGVQDFWAWDQSRNPERFEPEAVNA